MLLIIVVVGYLQIVQLYEMIIVRHGLMLVGAPFSGKSVGLKLLAGALTDLNAEGKIGTLFEKVEMRVINPKSVTMGQLYGEVDKATQEWKVNGCVQYRRIHIAKQCFDPQSRDSSDTTGSSTARDCCPLPDACQKHAHTSMVTCTALHHSEPTWLQAQHDPKGLSLS